MAVYVDNMQAKYGRLVMCHMVADTKEELLQMVDKIGVKRKWIQDEGLYSEHFDICMQKRKLAVSFGAVEITMRDFARICNLRPNAPQFLKEKQNQIDKMVTNFEEITEPLTADDLRFLPVLRRGLERHGKDDPIKAPAIVKALNDQRIKYDFQVRFTEARLRKLVNHLRTNGLLPVIATSSGYFVTYDPEIIRSQIRSLRDRASGIAGAANGLESFLE